MKRLLTSVFPALPAVRAAVERGQWRELGPQVAALGCRAGARVWFAARCQSGDRAARIARVRPRGFRYPLYFRPGGSDPFVIHQVFVEREYEAVARLPDVSCIVDCGANIGCTTFYLLHRYPGARAVVVEPDPGNMELCRRNLAPFRHRVTFVQAGVWSAAGPLVVERGAYRDGTEWSFRVRPAGAGEAPDATAVTVADLLAAGGFSRIDLLKIDIEGAEGELFARGAGAWLPLTRNVAIETHGPECERAVAAALAGYRYETGTSGELTVYRNLTRAPATPEVAL